MFTIFIFDKYVGIPFDASNLNIEPITPVIRGNWKQIPLKMAWALTIHKSQGLTLEWASIDIGNREQQGLTFTAISRVKSIDGLRIAPPFPYQRYAKMKDSAYVTIRKKKEERLKFISLWMQLLILLTLYRNFFEFILLSSSFTFNIIIIFIY